MKRNIIDKNEKKVPERKTRSRIIQLIIIKSTINITEVKTALQRKDIPPAVKFGSSAQAQHLCKQVSQHVERRLFISKKQGGKKDLEKKCLK